MRNYRPISILLLFLSFLGFSSAQQYLFDVEHITSDDGLAHVMTDAIYKDSKGYCWISTKYGLNRYDGYSFKLYTKGEHNLSGHTGLKRIVEDDAGYLWLFYMKGFMHTLHRMKELGTTRIDIFDPSKEIAVPIDSFFGGDLPFKVSDVCVLEVADPKKRAWIATKNGQLFLYRHGKFEKMFEETGVDYHHLVVDQKDRIWIAGMENVLCINMEGEIQERFSLDGLVKGIWAGKGGPIWMATVKILPDSRTLQFWKKNDLTKPLERFYLSGYNDGLHPEKADYRSIHQTLEGHWFISSSTENAQNDRFYVFDSQGEKLLDLHPLFQEGFKLKVSNFLVEEGQVWLATVTGVLKISITKNPFQLIHQREPVSDCRGITEDGNGNIYFLNRYIFKWNPRIQMLSKISTHYGTYSLVYEDSLLWASHREDGGLQVDLRNDREAQLGESNEVNHDYATLKTKGKGLYLTGREKGLYHLDITKPTISPFTKYNEFDELADASVYHFHRNTQGIWLASEKGIYLMTEEQDIVQRFDRDNGALPFNHIWYIHEIEQGHFWLATQGGGIIKWTPDIDQPTVSQYQQFTIANGLSNDYTYAIYEDDYGKLWIPSDKGLMCMDKQTFEVKTYLKENGLPHNEFNLTSHFKASDGTLYFGGLGGLISFHPSVFAKERKNQSPLEVLSFGVLETDSEDLTDQTEQLKNSHEIILNPSDKLFEMRFVLMDFDKKENHRYAYQIEGYDERWQFMENNVLRINSLPYGNYLLKVKAQNINKGWSENELELKVRMLRPFYLQWWFMLIAALAALGIIIAIVRRREFILKRDRQRLEEEVKKRTKKIEEDKAVIEAQAEELKVLDKAKTRFFSNITHEFRTPLTLVIGPLEQILNEQPPPTIFKRRMKGILKNARHLLTLINQLLDLSKIESGRMQTEVTRGDIVAYTQELVSRFQVLAQKKTQQLNFITPLESWETHFDKDKWDKILYNLLSNAIKFTAVDQNIQVSLVKLQKKGQDFIRLDVRDAGMGIEKEHLSQIFNRFYQVDGSSTRSVGGTGIGLALVKELVELQGGEIWVSSEVGKGTSFELYLPVLEAEKVSPLVHEPSPEISLPSLQQEEKSPVIAPVTATNEQSKLELLIVEDNEEMRDYIRYCLDASKYNITEAANGEEGIKKAQTLIPDLIISDVMMPKKNGFEVTSAIRNNISTSHIPLILLTARASLESRLEGLKRGADAYLTKPFSPKELAVRIQKLIDLRRSLQLRYQNDVQPDQNEQFQQEDEFISQLRSYILEHLDESDLNGDSIGKHFGMSRVHLYRKLNALTNQSISVFVRSVRLSKAMEFIREGTLNMSEIAYETGFSSIQHFSRTFKKAYGQAPSEFKNVN